MCREERGYTFAFQDDTFEVFDPVFGRTHQITYTDILLIHCTSNNQMSITYRRPNKRQSTVSFCISTHQQLGVYRNILARLQ